MIKNICQYVKTTIRILAKNYPFILVILIMNLVIQIINIDNLTLTQFVRYLIINYEYNNFIYLIVKIMLLIFSMVIFYSGVFEMYRKKVIYKSGLNIFYFFEGVKKNWSKILLILFFFYFPLYLITVIINNYIEIHSVFGYFLRVLIILHRDILFYYVIFRVIEKGIKVEDIFRSIKRFVFHRNILYTSFILIIINVIYSPIMYKLNNFIYERFLLKEIDLQFLFLSIAIPRNSLFILRFVDLTFKSLIMSFLLVFIGEIYYNQSSNNE